MSTQPVIGVMGGLVFVRPREMRVLASIFTRESIFTARPSAAPNEESETEQPYM